MKCKKLFAMFFAGMLITGVPCVMLPAYAHADEVSGSALFSGDVPAQSTPSASPSKKQDEPADVRISKTKLNIGIGQCVNLKLVNADEDRIKWTTSDDGIVSVKGGTVHGISEGRAVVKAGYGGKTFTCRVRVGGSGLDYSQYELNTGETLRLHINGASKKTVWSVKNKKIAKIHKKYNDNVCVRGLKPGVTVVSAKCGSTLYSCSIKVSGREKSVIYLTFDDGPSLTSTPKILDILKKNNVNATFFVINYDKNGEKLIKREIKDGNAVAIHGYSHDYAAIYRSEDAYTGNIKKMQDKLYETLGYRIWVTRFPGGSSNLVSRHYKKGIMSRLVKIVDKMGFAYFDWNVSSGDAGGSANSSQVYASVTRGLKKNRDNVVLMHDFSNNTKTIGALESVIKYGKSHGYVFKTITASTNEVHHGVQN